MLSTGGGSEMAYVWGRWLPLGSQCLALGGTQKRPTCGQVGCIAPTFSGTRGPQQGGKAGRGYITPFPGVPSAQHGEKIQRGPHVGKMAT